ncbi:C-5 cytosine-specific DNA methylase [Oscillochloris trichoides DG-6]|uniref:Cytosine-specific methyltransferase n=1 Tax=Oscillochloris trichoides DG-6 TaxID=765420 RepID=E1I9Y6_9CHLR|nr:DNA cytosine methyltransferase [Oscillochloris trichoides]EFO81988.1 C-5 cytosine-specific DNA methylase [Oscillochloris trichoides DG-6]
MIGDYVTHINTILKPQHTSNISVLDLFAGCGGLALGFEAQGLKTHGFEKDPDAAQTYCNNLGSPCEHVELSIDTVYPQADVVIGGPPCQPFSVGGYQRGLADSRDGFPIFIKAIENVRPKIWIFENVRGLMYQNKRYLEAIMHHLEDLGYIIDAKILNAVHYGVPQNRERLIVVGHKGGFSFPKPLSTKVTVGEALGEMVHSTPPESKFLTPSMDAYVAKYERASYCKVPRDLHLDKPSRTLTCRNIAAPTGDMMRVRLPDGRRRRILIREAARLQSFPDWFTFEGTETSQYYQIGNAVPPLLSYHIASSVKSYLEQYRETEVAEQYMRRERMTQLDLFTAD